MADVNELVTDQTLTLQLLHRLSRRYQVIATVLPTQTPFPTFTQARSRLLLEELNLDACDRADGSTALALELGGGGPHGHDRGGGSFGSDSGGDRGKAPMESGGSSSGGGGGHPDRGRDGAGGRGHGSNGAVVAAVPTAGAVTTLPQLAMDKRRHPGWGTLHRGARLSLRPGVVVSPNSGGNEVADNVIEDPEASEGVDLDDRE
ncbi:hypothetical protein ZWY2020_009502 [Hordeum vulgare]|nr:hypothetical protein ZWY2020_009502 [Hordeum vulgare]